MFLRKYKLRFNLQNWTNGPSFLVLKRNVLFNPSMNIYRGLEEFYFVLVHLEGKLTFLFQSKNFLKHSFNVEIIFRWSFNVGALPHFLEYFNNEYSDLKGLSRLLLPRDDHWVSAFNWSLFLNYSIFFSWPILFDVF